MKTLLRAIVTAVAVCVISSANAALAESLIAAVAAVAETYCCGQSPANAIDNDLDSTWNSGVFPPASITLDLGKELALSKVELLVAQNPSGTTTHQISVSSDLASWTIANTVTGTTGDRQWLSIPISVAGRYIRITTVEGPSWVAWREIRVFQQLGVLPVYGFWDQGFNEPKIRTTYNSPTQGTSTDPLTILSCIFGACPAFAPIYSAANAFSQNLPSFSDRQYWVLLNNNEPSYDNRCNSGPPDVSLSHSEPGYGVFGFLPLMDTGAGERFYRAHLVLDAFFADPCFGGIPYMSIGAHSNRGNVDALGNPQPLGALNATPGIPHAVSFKTRLYDYQSMHAALYRLVVTAIWPNAEGYDVARMIQLNLFHDGDDDSSSNGPATLQWNWPIAEDTFYPGAEVVYFDAEDVEVLCPEYSVYRIGLADRNADLSYDVDLQPLFECAARWGGWSNGLPATANIPITSIDWAVEGQANAGYLWTAVHDMRMH